MSYSFKKYFLMLANYNAWANQKLFSVLKDLNEDEINHPLLAQPVALGLVPLVQARLMARAVRDDAAPYVPFVAK